MHLSATAAALLCVASAAALGFGIIFALFALMYFGCLRIPNGGVANGNRRWRRERNSPEQLGSSSSGEAAAVERQWKGIPLNSRPPRLTPEQEILREKAMEKYKRRQARQERRSQRQAAREARMANVREGAREGAVSEDEFAGDSSDTSRTTLTSGATTVRTTSTVAYGRSSYLRPPSGDFMVHVGEHVDNDDRCSSRSGGSRSSRGSARSRASQGTVATIKSYLRHRQRQRLRRREEQQQLELFNQWAYAQMVSSSELSSSSKSVSTSSQHDGEGSATGGGARRRTRTACGSRSRNHVHPGRSASVASSAPRPLEDVLGTDCESYPFLMNVERSNLEGFRVDTQRPSPHPTALSANTSRCDAASPGLFTYSNGTTDATSPHVASAEHVEYAVRGGSGVHTGEHVDHRQPRRHKRTWKDVEHNVALSGFFNTPTNNNMASVDTASRSHYNDGEAPAPFLSAPGEPLDSSLGVHEPICHE
ncbi:putative transcription like protein nupm1 [Leishmania infantum JPCM5]|uniref:Transcription_like_protein_nupm1_-_putative n=2 Tax=Leishmania infantum TaxID=5671 RepID=A0A6L0XKV7_LEIIN|nr:putative transcription like protein nupm1 [Leishmania infantum JPCM5]CAC9520066.1 transcription_like_protein_nupm1_-_putative [Leishmania infantum]CAM70546.1 putative transcription like protein nupm1 [Leishmania infantum JPCM5]SUZ44422.1 transcription_like_protein_nupm1_-_putative [Leishmania infantum]|eukprot:XP_001467488.1 putative transcription like protein nupm1 [Leishmania infantum JPCM5]